MKKILKCIILTTVLVLTLNCFLFAADTDDPYKGPTKDEPIITVIAKP